MVRAVETLVVALLCAVVALVVADTEPFPLSAELAWGLGTEQYESVRDRTQGWQKNDITECYTGNEARRARAAPRDSPSPPPRSSTPSRRSSATARRAGRVAGPLAPPARTPRRPRAVPTSHRQEGPLAVPGPLVLREDRGRPGILGRHGFAWGKLEAGERRGPASYSPLRRGPRFERISLNVERPPLRENIPKHRAARDTKETIPKYHAARDTKEMIPKHRAARDSKETIPTASSGPSLRTVVTPVPPR